MKLTVAITLAMASHLAVADCQYISVDSETPPEVNIAKLADTETKIFSDHLTDAVRTCHVTARALVNNNWYTINGSATAGIEKSDEELCESAMSSAKNSLYDSFSGAIINSEKTQLCAEGTVSVHPVEPGDIIHYSESIPDPTRPGTFDYIPNKGVYSLPDYDNPPGNKCEFFVEQDPKNHNRYRYYGVRCRIANSAMWKVEIKKDYITPDEEVNVTRAEQLVVIDGIVAPLNWWQTYMIGGLTTRRGKSEDKFKCDHINPYSYVRGYEEQECQYGAEAEPTKTKPKREGE